VGKVNHNSNPKKGRGGFKSAAALRLASSQVSAAASEPLSKFGAQKIALFPSAAQGNPAGVFLQNLRGDGRRATRERLKKFASFFGHNLDSYPWAELSAGDVLTARGLLLDLGASKSTINMTLSALRGVARTQRRMHPDRMTAEVCAAICEVEGVRGSTPPAGRALREEEIAALERTCARDRSPAGARDLALLSLLYYQGLRRDEACRLEPEDWLARDRRLRVLGKGDKEEFVYVESKETRLALGRWLRRRGRVSGPLFCSVWRGGRVRADEGQARPLSGDAVYKIVERRARQASLRPCTPHDLRRSAITHLLERGTDALAVQAFARHEQLSTTTRYDRRREEAKREAARRLAEQKRVPPAPLKPRPRRAPRKGKRGRGGRPRMGLLEARPRAELVALARAHRCEFTERATRAELAGLIREAVAE
jgi:integrase